MSVPRDVVVGTAGHIDHGKTSLVRALTGVDTDRLPAEKQRGITIDLGYAALELEGHRISFVDVPGHERFIRNMVAGATGVDLALLVVAADDSVMPQTTEHLQILQMLGIRGGLVALTKADLVGSDWLELVTEEVRGHVRGTFLEGAPVVPVSSSTGAGLNALRAALVSACRALPTSPDTTLFRMPIDRSFTVAGHGTVVTGTIASGSVAVGDTLELWPEGRTVRVRALQRHEHAAERIARGSRAALNLVGVHHTEVVRGHEVAEPGYLALTRTLTAELDVSPDARRPLRHRGRYTLHIGTAEVPASLALLEGPQAEPGSKTLAQFVVARPLVAVAGEPYVLREESPAWTVGGGRVIQPTARRIRRRDLTHETRTALQSRSPRDRVLAAWTTLGLEPATTGALVRESGLAPDEIPPLLAALEAEKALVPLRVGAERTARVSAAALQQLQGRALRTLARLHAARTRQTFLPRPEVVGSLLALGGETLIGAVLDSLIRSGSVVSVRGGLALADHVPKLSQAERRLKDELAAALRAGGVSPPDLADLQKHAGARASAVPDLMALLVAEGVATVVGPGLWLDADAEASMRAKVAAHLQGLPQGMTMAELRDVLGTSRKYAVPIGEHLDRVGLTRRDGDVRFLAAATQAAVADGQEAP
jgi:selenocysteine-specific elongation factor